MEYILLKNHIGGIATKMDLLKIRKQIKKRKPKHSVKQVHQFAKLKNRDAWRKQKGLQNKMRLNKKGHKKSPRVGFRSPKLVREANKMGLFEIRVFNLNDLKTTKLKDNEIFILAKGIGGKKKLEMIEYCLKNKIKLFNVKNPQREIEKLTLKKKEVLAKKEKEVKEDKPNSEVKNESK